MKSVDLVLEIAALILAPIAKALGEDPEEARKELVKRVAVTDTSAEQKEKELEQEM